MKNRIAVKGFDGQAYIVDVSHLQKIQLEAKKPETTKSTEFAGITSPAPTNTTNFFEYQGFMAVEDDVSDTGHDLRTSINWNDNLANGHETILATTAIAPLNQQECTILSSLNKKPFYLDSGAMVHISPCRSDFIMLRATLPCSVRGIGGTSIEALGIGTIRLHIQNKAKIILENALYIPMSTVRLISISALVTGMRVLITFSSTGVTILDNN